jgi:isopentenyldiphosphate isomerase
MEEIIAIIDTQDKVIGKMTLSEAKRTKSSYRLISIILKDDYNNIILQQRALSKTFPNHFAESASGHVKYNETYEQAAQRELFEELHIQTPLTLISIDSVNYNEIEKKVGIFIGKLQNKTILINPKEISSIHKISIKTLKTNPLVLQMTPTCKHILGSYYDKIRIY